MRRSRFAFGLIFIAITLVITPVARPASSFTQIDVSFKGAMATQAFGTNKPGDVVGRYTTGGGVVDGFLLSGGTYTDLAVPKALATIAFGVNDTDAIVGYYVDSSNVFHGFLTKDKGVTFSTINVSGAVATVATGINNSGVIAGYYQDSTATHGFLLNGSTVTKLDASSSTQFTQAWGINAAGQVSGEYSDATGFHGFLYSGSTFTALDVPATVSPAAMSGTTDGRGLNTNCVVVGNYTDANSSTDGFMHQGTSFGSTLAPNAMDTESRSINDSGQVVGWFDGFDVNNNYFLHGFQTTVSVSTTSSCPSGTTKKHKHDHDRDHHDRDHRDRDNHDRDHHGDDDGGDN